MNKFLKLSAVLALVLSVSCTQSEINSAKDQMVKDPIDREVNMNRTEIKDAVRPSYEEMQRRRQQQEDDKQADAMEKSEMDYAPVVVSPESPAVKSSKRVSLSVTETVDVKDILMELSRLADLELALDPNIKGGVILSVNNRPVNEVLEMVADMAELRYTVDKGVLRVMKDNPYLENYNVDFLNLVRSSTGSINTQTQVLSAVSGSSGGGSGGSGSGGGGGSSGGGGGGGGSGSGSGSGGTQDSFNSGSTNKITTQYSGDLWKSIEDNLVAILGSNVATLKTADVQKASAPTAAEILAARDGKKSGGSTKGGPNEAEGETNEEFLAATDAGVTSRVRPTVNSVKSAPPSTYYTVNKQAGIVSVMATFRKHKAVKSYLDKVKASMSAQVLIEAKVIEVALTEDYATGIDWDVTRAHGVQGKFSNGPEVGKVFSGGSIFSGAISTSQLKVNAGSTNHPISSLMKMIEGFGVTRTLSNPRITVMNNQQAVLTFAKNQTYYTVTGSLQQNVATSTGGTTSVNLPVTISSSLHTIPLGVILALQPSIDLDTQEITMHVRPTLSTQVDEGINDPAVELLKQSIIATSGSTADVSQINSKVPIVQVRELDTVLKAKSGDVMIIGGLIQHKDQNSDEGVPFLSRIPLLGNAAKRAEKSSNVTETVILMQATIISPNGYYHPQDKKMYETFIQDSRPFVFN